MTKEPIKSASKKKKKIDIKKTSVRLLIIIAAVYFIYVMIWQQIMISRKNDELGELNAKIEQANEESARLQKEIENLSDPDYIESYAREHLGLVRPNERVFIDSNKSDDNISE